MSGVAAAIGGASDSAGALTSSNGGVGKYAREAPSASKLIELSQEWLEARGLSAVKRDVPAARKAEIEAQVSRLTKNERRAFDSLVAAYTYGSADHSLVKIAKIARQACRH